MEGSLDAGLRQGAGVYICDTDDEVIVCEHMWINGTQRKFGKQVYLTHQGDCSQIH